jgi:hypothetical protein
MTKSYGFCQILIEMKGTAYSASYLSYLKGMGKAGYIMVPQRSYENLCLVLEAAKSLRMDNTIPVSLEDSTYRTRLLRSEPAPR